MKMRLMFLGVMCWVLGSFCEGLSSLKGFFLSLFLLCIC